MRVTLCAIAVLAVACTADPVASQRPSPGPTTALEDSASPEATPEDAPSPDPAVVVMWAHGGLPADVARRAAALPDVVSAVHVRSDTLGLVGSRDADGRPVDDLGAGWRIPIEVRAVDPAAVAGFLAPGPTRDAVAALAPGEVLLPATSAERRGLGVGAEIDLEHRAGLVVAAVIEDDAFDRDELIVHADDADEVGLHADGAVQVLHDGTAGRGFAAALEALAPEDTAVRVVGTEEGEAPRRAPLVLDLSEVKDRFGEFAFRDDDSDREVAAEPAWVDAHIVVAEVPVLGRVRCHRAIIDDLTAALQAVADAGLASTIDRDDYGGCFHARRIGTRSHRLSHHSWGIAIDINVDLSLPGMGPPPDPGVIEAFATHGFRWGGLFLTPDNHHFEWVGPAAREAPPRAGVGDA